MVTDKALFKSDEGVVLNELAYDITDVCGDKRAVVKLVINYKTKSFSILPFNMKPLDFRFMNSNNPDLWRAVTNAIQKAIYVAQQLLAEKE